LMLERNQSGEAGKGQAQRLGIEYRALSRWLDNSFATVVLPIPKEPLMTTTMAGCRLTSRISARLLARAGSLSPPDLSRSRTPAP
jgi:hypothetical protein